jgi:hypothetical protein
MELRIAKTFSSLTPEDFARALMTLQLGGFGIGSLKMASPKHLSLPTDAAQKTGVFVQR